VKVLVTGAEGFIGRNVTAAFAEGDDEVFYGARKQPDGVPEGHFSRVDLHDKDSIRAALAEAHPDVIVNCAGIVDPSQDFDNNRAFTENLLEAVETSGQKVGRVIVCSSAGVYGQVEPGELPVSERTPLRATSPYALSKKAEEEIALRLGGQYGIPVTVARIFNPIGPGMGPKFLISNVLSQINEVEAGRRTELEVGRLDSERDYIAVGDVARAIKAIAHGEPNENVYNVGSGKNTTNSRLVKLIMDSHGISPQPPIRETNPEPDVAVASQADISKISNDLGWKPEVTLEDEIQRVVEDAKRK
jgi:GDP-4-dehydro-6-deoxy-D-mannose reductase